MGRGRWPRPEGQGMNEELIPEELVVSVYGGDNALSQKILRRYEVLATPERLGDEIRWSIPDQLKIKIEGPIWINRCACMTPQQMQFINVPDVLLPILGLPFKVDE